MDLKPLTRQSIPNVEVVLDGSKDFQRPMVECHCVDGPIGGELCIASVTIKDHDPAARDHDAITAEGAQRPRLQALQFPRLFGASIRGLKALDAAQSTHIPQADHPVEIHTHELVVGLRHLAKAGDAALVASQLEGQRTSAGVPNGDVVVEASAQQHLALRTELQAGEAFGVPRQHVLPGLQNRIKNLRGGIHGCGGQALQWLQPFNDLNNLRMPIFELKALVGLHAPGS
mmetsp:Transcript_11746/g.27710  ORF Transcript_11746/g.27710 Transcript_11746/m.27710 type:complete len:230 (+) Transcript_11746:1335-2024(+)